MNKLITNKITLISFFVIICHFTAQAQDSAKKVIVVVRPGGITKTEPANTTPSASTTTPSATIKPANSSPALLANNKTNAAAPGTPGTTLASTAPASSKPTAVAPGTPGNTLASTAPATTKPKTIAPGTQGNTLASTAPASSKPAVGGTTPAAKTGTGGTLIASTVPANSAQKSPVAPYVAPGSRVTTYNAPTTAERSGSASYMQAKTNANGNASKYAAGPATGNASKYAAATSPAAGKANTTAAVGPPAKMDTVMITKLKHDTVAVPPAKHKGNKILFAEIGGPGIAISINYDQRFDKTKKDGFGFRVGLGYFAAGNNTVFTIPAQLNYLYGKDGKYIELGIGTTFINSRGDNYSSPTWEFDTVTGLAATAVIGVRYEPSKALNFRLGYVPIVSSYGLINAGGFSVGYTF